MIVKYFSLGSYLMGCERTGTKTESGGLNKHQTVGLKKMTKGPNK